MAQPASVIEVPMPEAAFAALRSEVAIPTVAVDPDAKKWTHDQWDPALLRHAWPLDNQEDVVPLKGFFAYCQKQGWEQSTQAMMSVPH